MAQRETDQSQLGKQAPTSGKRAAVGGLGAGGAGAGLGAGPGSLSSHTSPEGAREGKLHMTGLQAF